MLHEILPQRQIPFLLDIPSCFIFFPLSFFSLSSLSLLLLFLLTILTHFTLSYRYFPTYSLIIT